MRPRASWAWLITGVLVWVSGCSAPQGPPLVVIPTLPRITPTQPATATPLILLTPPTSAPASGTQIIPGADPYAYAQAAIRLLAGTLGVPETSVLFISIMPVEWPDTSLGCPQPGQSYAQVITPGYIINLDVGGTPYEIHSDQAGAMIMCTIQAGGGTPTPPDPVVAEFIQQARAQLASLLGVPLDQVVLVRSEAVDWLDQSLGCRQTGQEYSPGPISGYRIILSVEEQRYEFHTDFQRILLCENPTE